MADFRPSHNYIYNQFTSAPELIPVILEGAVNEILRYKK
jgi:hypothetical protein